jgi:hypothetical protein
MFPRVSVPLSKRSFKEWSRLTMKTSSSTTTTSATSTGVGSGSGGASSTSSSTATTSSGGGAPNLLSSNLLTNGITADASAIYWVNRQDGYIKTGPFDLSNETPLGAGDVPWDIVVDGTNAYWTCEGSSPGVGTVTQASKVDGSSAIPLAMNAMSPAGIAVDATTVYWTDLGDGTLDAGPIDGGAKTVLATIQQNPPHHHGAGPADQRRRGRQLRLLDRHGQRPHREDRQVTTCKNAPADRRAHQARSACATGCSNG